MNKKKKYFIITDVHSFYDEMITALNKAGFDKNNPDHILISCGDLFDRGKKPRECLDFVMSIPKSRRIFIKGNHEDNLQRLLHGAPPEWADKHNGTLNTILLLGNKTKPKTEWEDAIKNCNNNKKLQKYLGECRNYYETDNYLFVHGWYPYIPYDWFLGEENNSGAYDVHFYRTASVFAWKKARWDCGFHEWASQLYDHEKYGVPMLDKTVVCGHWHVSYAHSRFHNLGQEWANKGQKINKACHFEPFYDEGIIGLDACTIYSGFCNCIVLEDKAS